MSKPSNKGATVTDDLASNLILVDSSVWIEYFRKKTPFYTKMEELIEENRVSMIPFVLAELLQGTRSEEEFKQVQGASEIFSFLKEKESSWIEAAHISFTLRKNHHPIGLGDCYIAAIAIQNSITLWSLDKHFLTIQKYFKALKLY